MSLGFQCTNNTIPILSCLQAAFRKFYGRYNDLVFQYNVSLGKALSGVFHTNRQTVFETLILTTVGTIYLNWN
jgi:hypothetical protein